MPRTPRQISRDIAIRFDLPQTCRPLGARAPTHQPHLAKSADESPRMTDDNSHRIHLAANDPAFPAKREAAFAVIVAAVARVAAPMGYTLRGSTFARETAAGKTAINVQRSRYGFDAIISLRFLLPDGSVPESGIWADDAEVALAQFAPEGAADPGTISYLDVHEDAACLDATVAILADHALPWLESHHNGAVAPISPVPAR